LAHKHVAAYACYIYLGTSTVHSLDKFHIAEIIFKVTQGHC